MEESNLAEFLKNGLENINSKISSKTIMGEAISLDDGQKVFPVSKIISGSIGGGGEYKTTKKSKPCAMGVSHGSVCEPVGFFVSGDNPKFIPIKEDNTVLNMLQNLSKAVCYFVKTSAKSNYKKMKEETKNAKK